MLKLKEIKKNYLSGEQTVEALKGINLEFRKNEFVSILGHSGCGKTTLLNIIGGLDKYTTGDLYINGESTKDFQDRDWDNYRNHSIGFVFQSYNLIPHQSVLQNVELALTLSGVSKSERRKRAKAALEQVGLSNQLHKKPSEMSGGQMQRVAIARAIVNNPDIILADEPTGALDTETSVQVMDILKEISKDKLVIMVTHNPDLANSYSTRIIRMLDGVITSDSNPITEKEKESQNETSVKTKTLKSTKKPSMSLLTSFGLSLKNLFTKKGRTALTSFAGSIGIIGIALVFAVSQGMTTYINTVQEETLSSYPLTLEAQTMDLSSLLTAFMGVANSGKEHEKDAVYQKSMIYDMINALNTAETNENDLKSFKKYLEKKLKNKDSDLYKAINGVSYSYNLDLLVYTENIDGTIIRSDSQELLQEILIENLGMDLSGLMSLRENSSFSGGMMSMGSSYQSLWQELLAGEDGSLINDLVEKQYDLIYGSWPNKYNEILLVVDENNELDDMTLYALGLKTKEEINYLTQSAFNQTEIEYEEKKWSYQEILDMDFRVILNSNCYTLDKNTGLYTDLRETTAGLKYLYDNGINLKVTGIIRPNEDSLSKMISGSIGYTKALTEYVINNTQNSNAVKAQLENKTTDIFTGLTFKDTKGEIPKETKAQKFGEYLASLDENGKADAYLKIMSIPSKEQTDNFVNQTLSSMKRADIESTLTPIIAKQTSMSEKDIAEYLASFSEEDLNKMFSQMLVEQFKINYAEQVNAQLSNMPKAQLAYALDMAKQGYTVDQLSIYYDEILTFSESSYEENLKSLGVVDLESPSKINIYASSFDNKDVIEKAIADYNKDLPELSQIKYTDYVGIMMSFVTTVINAITYVLISFVAVSLIVSSIMIGVITLISVQERTKEIGILRAIGASKRNVSSMFNAETVIIGFVSGVIGIIITYLLSVPINSILHTLTGINNLNIILPIPVAIILVCISVLLTLIAGIIPSRSAAKKDPVVALRTE